MNNDLIQEELELKKSFKNNIKAFREEQHLTQERLADMIGVAVNTIRNWELGRIDRLNPVILERLRVAFGKDSWEDIFAKPTAWPKLDLNEVAPEEQFERLCNLFHIKTFEQIVDDCDFNVGLNEIYMSQLSNEGDFDTNSKGIWLFYAQLLIQLSDLGYLLINRPGCNTLGFTIYLRDVDEVQKFKHDLIQIEKDSTREFVKEFTENLKDGMGISGAADKIYGSIEPQINEAFENIYTACERIFEGNNPVSADFVFSKKPDTPNEIDWDDMPLDVTAKSIDKLKEIAREMKPKYIRLSTEDGMLSYSEFMSKY